VKVASSSKQRRGLDDAFNDFRRLDIAEINPPRFHRAPPKDVIGIRVVDELVLAQPWAVFLQLAITR
jgi:hypothetical protein